MESRNSFATYMAYVTTVTIWPGIVTGILALICMYMMFGRMFNIDVAFPVALILGIGVIFYSTPKLIKKQESKRLDIAEKINQSMERIDYYFISYYGGIAIDLKNKEISLACYDQGYKNLSSFKFNFEKVIEYGVNIASYEEIQVIEENCLNKMQSDLEHIKALKKNAEEKSKAYSNTGILFKLDDIHEQSAFVQVPEKHAEKWIFLLSKAFDGELELEPCPSIYPKSNDFVHYEPIRNRHQPVLES